MEYNGKFRVYKSPLRESANFDDVVPDIVSVDVNNMGKYVKPWSINHDTVFDSVKIVPYKEPAYLTEFIESIEPHHETIDFIYQTFVDSIEEHWDENKIHVIGCSSGYDSRLIAKAIQDLTKKNGREWLGEYMFVENGGEGDGFVAIMKALKFDKYISWEPKYDMEYFENVHRRFNGISSFPVNQWYDLFEKNFDDLSHVQYITGYGANVTEAARLDDSFIKEEGKKENPIDKLRDFFKWQYYLQMPAFKEIPGTMYPFWNFNYIRATMGGVHWKYRMSHVLVEEKVPECRHIKRVKLTELDGNGSRIIDAGVMEQLNEWYLSTDFGRENKVKPSNIIEYNKWWLHFSVASYLQDHKITSIGVRTIPIKTTWDIEYVPRVDQRIILPEEMKDVTIVGIDCGGSHACGLSVGMRRYASVTSVWKNKNKHGLDNIDLRSWFGWENIPPEGDELIIVSAITYTNLLASFKFEGLKKLFDGYKKKKIIFGDGRIARDPERWNNVASDFDEVFCHICKIHFRGDKPTKLFIQPFDMSKVDVRKNDILTVAHSPFVAAKNREKGTHVIVDAMKDYPDVNFDLITGLPWEEAMRRKAAAHIFVDQVAHYDLDKFKFNDDNYEWPALGKSGIEAMHLGCLVITRGQPEARDIPSPPVAWCTTDNFRDVLRYYITHHKSREELAKKQQRWAYTYSTYDFAARHVLGIKE